MPNKKIAHKKILLYICHIILLIIALVMIVDEFIEYFCITPANSLIGVFIFFILIISITLAYSIFVQKEPYSKILYHIKTVLPYLAIPAFMSFLVIATLPFFVQIESKVFDLIVIFVVILTGIFWIVLLKRKKGNSLIKKKETSGERNEENSDTPTNKGVGDM